MGLPIPDAIANRPELAFGLEWYLTAFYELGTDRPIGFGPGPIPGSAIREFALWYGVSPDEYDDFNYLIRELDGEWLKWAAKQVERQKPSGSK